MPIIRTGFTYSGRADQPGEFCYNFSQMTLLRWLTFLLRSQTVILTILLFCIYFFLMLIFFSTMVFPPLFISLILLLSQFPLTFHEIHNRMPCFIARLFLCWLGQSSWSFERFHWSVSLNSLLLPLLMNFVSWFRLELLYISLIENIRSSLTHLCGF